MNPNPLDPTGSEPAAGTPAEAPPERYQSVVGGAPTRRKVKSLLGWRTKHHLGQAEAARILGVSTSTYGRFEARKRFPRPSVAKRMMIITGLSAAVIAGLDD